MAKSKISIDIKCANSALGRFLVRKEEEQQLLQIGKRKPRREDEEQRLPVGRGRWLARHDFTWPTCLVDRPRTLDGATSFHFEFRAVPLKVFPTFNGRPIAGLSKPSTHPALDHAKYIERDGAAEKFQSSGHADYIERPDGLLQGRASPIFSRPGLRVMRMSSANKCHGTSAVSLPMGRRWEKVQEVRASRRLSCHRG